MSGNLLAFGSPTQLAAQRIFGFALTPAMIVAFALLSSMSHANLATTLAVLQADLKPFVGEWIYVEDRTPDRALEQLGPPMSGKFSLDAGEGALILASGHGSGHKNVRVALDGAVTEVPGSNGDIVRYRGEWKDGAFTYEVTFVRAAGQSPGGLIRRELRITPDGLLVSATSATITTPSIALYRKPQDIPMPTPAKATIGDMKWLAGAWVGARGTGGAIAFEERWTPPKGGAMLATSRTVSRDKMSAFEFLRIVERDGGLVYVAQPNGAPPTDFVLTEITLTRAVFDNPRHDYPKRIVYELSADGALTATIGFLKGGTPRRFEFKRESQ